MPILLLALFLFTAALLTLVLGRIAYFHLVLPPPLPQVEFVPPPPSSLDSIPEHGGPDELDELIASLRARFRDLRAEVDPRDEDQTVEDLRLLICVRQLQCESDDAILEELLDIGLVADYALGLLASAQWASRSQQIGLPGPLAPTGLGGFAGRSRTSSRIRPELRAARRLERARRLAGLVGETVAEVQSFPAVPPYVPKPDLARFLVVGFLIAVAVATTATVIILKQ